MELCAALLLQTSEAWIDALRSENIEERHRAETALAAAGPDVRCSLETLRGDPDADVRAVAARLAHVIDLRDVLPPRVLAWDPRIADRLARRRWLDILEDPVEDFDVLPRDDRHALAHVLLDAARAREDLRAFLEAVEATQAVFCARAVARALREAEAELRPQAWKTLEGLVRRMVRATLTATERRIVRVELGLAALGVPLGAPFEVPVSPARRRSAVLDDREVHEGEQIPELGLRVVRIHTHRIEIAPLAR